MNENNDKDLRKMFKRQFKVQLNINLINSALIIFFIVLFRKNLTIVIFFAVLIVLFWFYSGIKLYFLQKAIKKMESGKTTLTKKEKESSIEAIVKENDSQEEGVI